MMQDEAHAFLDAVRDGAEASEAEITAALRSTGDIDFDVIQRSHRPIGSWERIIPSQLHDPVPSAGLHVTCPRTMARIARELAA